MTTPSIVKSPLRTARLAGVLYLSLIPLGILGIIYVPFTLIEEGNTTATISNILAAESLFRLSILAALIVPIVNTVLVLVLFNLFRSVSTIAALIMVLFLLLGVPIAMLNELTNISVLALLNDNEYRSVFETSQLNKQVMLLLELHESGVYIAGIFWGLWLLPLGYLIYRSAFLPGFLGVLLIIGGFGYLVDTVFFLIAPDLEIDIAQYTFVGEVLFPLWLLIKGVDVRFWEQRTALV